MTLMAGIVILIALTNTAHPAVVRRLVLVSAGDEFAKLLDRMGELMRKPYNWADDVKTLEMPVMLIFGDSDMYRLEHIVEFYHLLGGGLQDAGWMREHMSNNRLAILPDLTHYEMFMSPALPRTALPFLNGESGAGSWAEQVESDD